MRKTRFELSQDASEFLFYSCYGETWKQLKNEKDHGEDYEAIYCCFRRAYRDFNRTLRFDKKEKGKQDFPSDVFYYEVKTNEGSNENEDPIGSMISHILDTTNQDDFDNSHYDICTKIKNIAEDERIKYFIGEFYYGQAQKWLNMTLKYMYMSGLWNDEFEKSKWFLHIPLDRDVIKAVFFKDTREKINNTCKEENLIIKNYDWADSNGKFLPKNAGLTDYQDNVSIPWSKMDVTCYKKIQREIRNCRSQTMLPLDWENEIWLRMQNIDTE